jgi:hypothetical protein
MLQWIVGSPPTAEIQMSNYPFSEAWVRVIRTLALGEVGRSTGTNSAGTSMTSARRS